MKPPVAWPFMHGSAALCTVYSSPLNLPKRAPSCRLALCSLRLSFFQDHVKYFTLKSAFFNYIALL